MLRDATTGRRVDCLPRRPQEALAAVLARLEPHQVVAMEQQIEEWADSTGEQRTDFFASNWLTGNDWKRVAGGVFEPLYEACEDHHDNAIEYAGWMFGWLVRRVTIRRLDEWVMYKNPEAGSEELSRNMWGTFYWREHRAA
jgi:hypothetical protein